MPVTTRLMGGLGNQLFQIATGYGLAKKHNTSFFLFDDAFDGCGQGNPPSKYTTIYSNFDFKKRTDMEPVVKHKERMWHSYDIASEIDPSIKNIELCGYFQSDLHFKTYKSDILSFIMPKCGIVEYLREHSDLVTKYPELFDANDYCFIGVRRGDYLRNPHIHNPCGMTYYRKAMDACPASKYYIASDDMAWCRANFIGPQYVFLDISDDLDLMYLGCLFPKYIISNSSYHWWISYVSVHTNPIIIAPSNWISGAHKSIYREGMIVLNRPVEV
jgi:hypothetical protein